MQYTIAVDRGNERITNLYQPTHPAVLRLIKITSDAAHANGIWVGVCGEMASEFHLTPLLLGLGIDELSVGTASVPRIKKAVQSLELAECRKLAEDVQDLEDPLEIERLSRELAQQRYPELFEH